MEVESKKGTLFSQWICGSWDVDLGMCEKTMLEGSVWLEKIYKQELDKDSALALSTFTSPTFQCENSEKVKAETIQNISQRSPKC